jgi:hypothetical protein
MTKLTITQKVSIRVKAYAYVCKLLYTGWKLRRIYGVKEFTQLCQKQHQALAWLTRAENLKRTILIGESQEWDVRVLSSLKEEMEDLKGYSEALWDQIPAAFTQLIQR